MAVPVLLIVVAGAGLAIPVPATAASHASRPGQVATGETGAAASPVVSVRTWGDNSAGELGDGTLTERTTPVPAPGLSGVQAISANGRHDLALLANGTVMSWGDNSNGQRPLAERWNGRSWSGISVPTPGGAGQATLSGVDDLSPADAWAAGTRTTAG
jgi:Regulator of chromosome condensation (RCC1) repeat